MRRTGLKVSAAPNSTSWTLSQSQADQQHYEQDMPSMANGAYGGHDDEGYGTYPSTNRTNSAGWKPSPAPAQTNGYANGNFDYNTPLEERSSHQISLNTRVRSQGKDPVTKHLLHETALLDTQGFEILTIQEVDALKKEGERLRTRLEAAQRQLAFESKVRDAAQNLTRLYSYGSSKGRADTPQSPDSPKRPRRSLLGQRRPSSSSIESKSLGQAEEEVASSTRKVDELNETIKKLLDRRQIVERKLLQHTAAVLAQKKDEHAEAATNGHFDHERERDSRASSIYSPDEFDGIRDILCGAPVHSSNRLQKRVTSRKLQEEHEEQLHGMQMRLEQLNDQLRSVISEAGRSRGVEVPPEPRYGQVGQDDPAGKLTTDFDRLENNLRHLQQEQHETSTHVARVEEHAHRTVSSVEEQLEGLNTQLHNTLLLSSAATLPDLQEPPEVTGQDYQPQLTYLEECFGNVEHLLRQHNDDLREARESGQHASRELEGARNGAAREIEEANGKLAVHTKKVNEYDATLGGLWEILQSDAAGARGMDAEDTSNADDAAPVVSAKESFSLPAFNSRVQHLFDRAMSAREQQDILRRQVQQQRELNGKSDAEKDRQLEELNKKNASLVATHGSLQDELAKAMANHTQSESEVGHLRAEFLNVENELEQLRRTADTKGAEREEMARSLQTHQSTAAALQEKVDNLEAQVAELIDDARIFTVESDAQLKNSEAKHADLTTQLTAATSAREAAETKHITASTEMQNLENEVVRLTTELAMAKAELDGAYGSRAERAKEAQASEVQALNERNVAVTAEVATLRSTNAELERELSSFRSAPPQDTERTKVLETELTALTSDFQDLTRESLQLEHERTQLDYLIDGLRDRVEALEGQLSDEKVRWLGIKSPATAGPGGRESVMGRAGGEGVSVMVLRQEFKRMMRETRAEGVRALRAEQDHRRALETQLRHLRHAHPSPSSREASATRAPNGTLTPNAPSASHTAHSSVSMNGLMVNSTGHGNGHDRGGSTASFSPPAV
ncbi:hypothetical protein B0A48_05511 [Cryoendolithus antarcticus]|uniref:REM-1 domain-containing protein n=1 Tax=Cryoendolithus antarcticus TaxID=1507870 RepID=A0A1V8TIP6_9PEZI|nr:hypothetical protein B0A48_05511 [Cryoendolithus antarcticus]